jgi:hypothetical protein
MSKSDEEQLQECMQKFIEQANGMKEAGLEPRVVSAALMTASAVYATYVFAGNNGRLNAAGVDRLTGGFKEQLQRVQDAKKAAPAE